MKIASLLTCAIIFSVSAAPFSWAETTTPAKTTAAPADASTPAASSDEKKAKSKECSTEADAKGLRGKARKKFREDCKHGK